MIRKKEISLIFFVSVILLCVSSVEAQCNNQNKRVGALISMENDDGRKTPLILIHGIHGTALNEERTKPNQYWSKFTAKFVADKDLSSKYSLYIFQYYSNQESVQGIACELGQFIDEKLSDRQHVILAHSMGGLVAKAYMAYYKHKSGRWAGTTGGDTILGAITLATPHHGTPGANDTDALKDRIGLGWKSVIGSLNFTYWSIRTEFFSPQTLASGNPNRGDLRWDNYDGAISANSLTNNDVNVWLPNANEKFRRFSGKVILYAGVRRLANIADSPKSALAVAVRSVFYNDHQNLRFANDVLVNGFSNRFGITDGLVPYKSALLCQPQNGTTISTGNYICQSDYRVRRFEAGRGDALTDELPDKTLSIKRRLEGFDHKDMYEDEDVLKYVVSDLRGFIKSQTTPLPQISPSTVPILFLFDVSSSMNESDKIGQARASSLTAMREIQENKRLGRGDAAISIWAFSGNCSQNAARQILPFTENLTQAENALSAKIPRPDGGTPLPQGIEKATVQISAYLNQRPELSEGRIILLSDGQSTCGEIRPAGVYSLAKTITVKKIRFLTIGFDVAPGSAAERDLQYLASSSDGQYFPAQNQPQLARAFEKTIRIYLPKRISNASPEFENIINAITNRDFQKAREFAADYIQRNPSDAFGYYNLAVALEALSFYKGAAENYRKYLQFAPDAADRSETEARIVKLEQDYRDQFFYYQNILQSDLSYLKAFYGRIFNREIEKNAAEFAGFVAEKQEFYANLTDILEIRSARIERDATDLSDSLGILNRRAGLQSFDRDAVSLLTIPIGHLEDVIERVQSYANQNLR